MASSSVTLLTHLSSAVVPQTGCWPGPAPATVRLLGLGIDWWPGHGASPGRVWCGRSAVRTLSRTAAAGPRRPVLGTTPPPAPPCSCPAPGHQPGDVTQHGPAPPAPPPPCRPRTAAPHPAEQVTKVWSYDSGGEVNAVNTQACIIQAIEKKIHAPYKRFSPGPARLRPVQM